jgi:hypothetical protein
MKKLTSEVNSFGFNIFVLKVANSRRIYDATQPGAFNNAQ